MGTPYKKDIYAWANEQAYLLRSGKLSSIDVENIADEIEDVGKSERKELNSRLIVLLSHLLKWQFQPSHNSGFSWVNTIKEQRVQIKEVLRESPSLKNKLNDVEFMASVWKISVLRAESETGLDVFPKECLWDASIFLDDNFFPRSE